MPNHVTNKLHITGKEESIIAFLDSIKGKRFDDGSPCFIDFNRITPMPEVLLETTSGGGEEYALAKAFMRVDRPFGRSASDVLSQCDPNSLADDQFDHLIQLITNQRKYGHTDWYSWAIKNWGTKWGAYSQSMLSRTDGSAVIRFDTAWSCVVVLIEKAIAPFRDGAGLNFVYEWADEDTGSNTGRIIFGKDDTNDDVYQPEDCSNKAYELCFEINPGAREFYKKDDAGNWEYGED